MKIARNIDLLTEEEAQLLCEFNALYAEVIKVDEFSFDLKTVID